MWTHLRTKTKEMSRGFFLNLCQLRVVFDQFTPTKIENCAQQISASHPIAHPTSL